jgi:hypothetical protein
MVLARYLLQICRRFGRSLANLIFQPDDCRLAIFGMVCSTSEQRYFMCSGQSDAKAIIGHAGCRGQVQPSLIASFEPGNGTRKSES